MQPGDRVADRFELLREMGAGGMGTVWQARDADGETIVALKVLNAGASRERFEQESALLASIEHPGIVRYVAHGVDGDAPYLAMEWVEGVSLDARLEHGPLGVDATVVLGARMCEALATAHAQGVVHRDLKPANVMLQDGDAARPKLLDFGIARAAHLAHLQTQPGVPMGTPGYMAPEQARGEAGVDARADLFSLGCILYECVAGRPAFAGVHVIAILTKILLEDPAPLGQVASVPPGLDALVGRMLAKDKGARPAGATGIAAELRALVGAVPRARVSTSLLPPDSVMTGREQRFVAIVLRGASVTDAEAATMAAEAEGEAATPLRGVVLEAVRRHGAKLEMLAGGGLALLVPGEGSATDVASRAAACALALRDGSPIALSMGRAEIAGKLPVGEAIDRAARLIRRRAGPLWVDETTAGLLDEGFLREQRDGGDVLLGRRETDAVRTLCGRPTACVGREAWLSALEAIFDEAMTEPEARAAVVTAPSGVGKSRVRFELLRRLRTRAGTRGSLETWAGRGDVIGAGSSFGLVAQMVRRAAGIQEGEPAETRRDKLASRVGRHVPADRRHRVAVFLGEMIGTRFPDEADVQLQAARRDAIVMGDQIRRAWEDLVDAETAHHPLALVLEDLHWGDAGTVTMVDNVLRLYPRRPLFVVAFGRPELDSLFPALWAERNVERVELPPLPRAAAEKLARSVLGAGNPDVARVVEQAGGNAFYLEELIRAVAEGRGDRLPDTVLGTVEARITTLGPEARKALRAASVFGQTFWEDGVRALGGDEAAAMLDELERGELVARHPQSKLTGQTELVFRHALVREAAYAMLVDDDRVLGHQLAADWLEAHGETDALFIAEHLERAGENARATVAFERAARQALEANELAEAVARADRGAALGAEGDGLGHLRLIQAEARRWRGDWAGAREAGEQALRLLARGSDAWGEAASELAVSAWSVGDAAMVVGAGEALLEAASRAASTGVLVGAARASMTLMQAGHPKLAAALHGAVEQQVTADAAPAVHARLSLARAIRALHAGDPAAFLEWTVAAAAAFESGGDTRNVCAQRVSAGYAHILLGDYAASEQLLRAALAEAERLHLPNIVATAKQNLGWALARQGRVAEGVAMLRECLVAFVAQGDRRMDGGTRAYLAAVLADAGDLDQAEREAVTGGRLLGATTPPWALAVHARVLGARGEATAALEMARAAMEGLEALGGGMEEGEADVRLIFAEALERVGDHEGARRAIGDARARLMARAAKIQSDGWRESFLRSVPEHARTLELARAWQH